MKKARVEMKNTYRLLINYRLYLGALAGEYSPNTYRLSYRYGLVHGIGFALGFSDSEIEKDLLEMVEKGHCSRLDDICLQYSQQEMEFEQYNQKQAEYDHCNQQKTRFIYFKIGGFCYAKYYN